MTYSLKNFEQWWDLLLTVSEGFTCGGFRKVALVPFEFRQDGLDVHGIPDNPSTGAKACSAIRSQRMARRDLELAG